MSRRIPLWCAGLSLVVTSAAAVTHVDAQVRSDRRIRRTGKDTPQPTRADTVTVMRTDTLRVSDTVYVDRQLPAPPPRVDTLRVPAPIPYRPVYFAVAGGAALPLQDSKDIYNIGPHLQGSIGFNAPIGPFGLRLDGSYSLLRGKNVGRGYVGGGSAGNYTFPDLGVYTGTAELVLRARFGNNDSTSAQRGPNSFYVFGGGGVAHVRGFVQETGKPYEQNMTRGTANGGAGLEFGRLSGGAVFVEGRYATIFTPNVRVSMIPVVLGVRF